MQGIVEDAKDNEIEKNSIFFVHLWEDYLHTFFCRCSFFYFFVKNKKQKKQKKLPLFLHFFIHNISSLVLQSPS
jgi:hypothetical protein